ncbi:MAG TPA: 2'-5' RNA ligase family protein [Rubrivivax sp.]|nr:2'-5' RNA ligase family protein [Rubrivivax sp.]
MMPRPPHRLFFAALPDAAAGAQAHERIHALQVRQGLAGHPTATDRRHVTLHWLGDHEAFPADLVADACAACAAGAAVGLAPFEPVFDRLGSIGDVRRPGPVVLSGGDGLRGLRELQRALGRALQAAHLGCQVREAFVPHMTQLYPRPMVHVPVHAVAPLSWTLREWVLIDSQARGSVAEYRILGRWPLRSRQPDLLDG